MTRACMPERRDLQKMGAVFQHLCQFSWHYGVTQNTVRQWFKHYGMSPPPSGVSAGVVPKRQLMLEAVLVEKRSNLQLMQRWAVPRRAVKEWRRRFKLPACPTDKRKVSQPQAIKQVKQQTGERVVAKQNGWAFTIGGARPGERARWDVPEGMPHRDWFEDDPRAVAECGGVYRPQATPLPSAGHCLAGNVTW